MRSRGLRILLLGVFSLWFGVIVPGHERGAVSVPGYKAQADGGRDACRTKTTCHNCPTEPAGEPAKSPEPDPSSHCAICHLIGVLDAPITVHFTVPEAQLLACLPPTAYQSIAGVSVLSIDRGRGPPFLFI